MIWGARDGTVVRALAPHRCGPGSNPGGDAICVLSLLQILSFALRGFSPGTLVFSSPQKLTFPNSNSTRNQVDEEHFVDVLPLNRYLFIYFIYLKYINYDYSGSPLYDHPYITYSFVCPNGKLTLFL